MIPRECKRLAEVDFPIAEVSRESAREKSIRHGHPSTMHLWWARRPLAACRAMLLGLLLPDPCDPACPVDFKNNARRILSRTWQSPGSADTDLRRGLLEFTAAFANWDKANDPLYLELARGLVNAASPESAPMVVDPFSGGGSIPLEALRIGCDAFASDLNPVACMILKVLLEDIPRFGRDLADEFRNIGEQLKSTAAVDLAQYYPPDPDGSVPNTYLWSRTVQCETPSCGAEILLVRSFWLCKKPTNRRAIRYEVIRKANVPPILELAIVTPSSDVDIQPGTVRLAKATCPCCNTTLGKDRVRAQLMLRHGGADPLFDSSGKRIGGSILLSKIVKTPSGAREYRLPTESDYRAVWLAGRRISEMPGLPEEGIKQARVAKNSPFRVHLYGMTRFADIFSCRQKLALLLLISRLQKLQDMRARGLLGCLLSRCADYWSSNAIWESEGEFVKGTFARQALSVVWDFAEAVPLADSSGSIHGAIDWIVRVVQQQSVIVNPGQVQQLDACASNLLRGSASVWFTDPPYYDAVSYADLSDFFYVWLKKALTADILPRDLAEPESQLTPKAREAIQDEYKIVDGRPKDRAFYEDAMSKAFREGRRVLSDDGIATVVFAHKTTEGWEALLTGIIAGGFVITSSWPISTERPGRLRSQNSAALATSVHLVCRPRIEDTVGDWTDVLRQLPRRVTEWMTRLQAEGVRGADLVFACIGPALEIFSRYSRVETPAGEIVGLAEYLQKVWEVVGRSALEQILGSNESQADSGSTGVLEEDARLTALFLWTIQATFTDLGVSEPNAGEESEDDEDSESAPTPGKKEAGFALVFDVVRRFAQPLGIHLPDWEGRVIETKKGSVRLLPVRERASQLFGEGGTDLAAERIETARLQTTQLDLFSSLAIPESKEPERARRRGNRSSGRTVSDEALKTSREATTLDRVHAAMLLQSAGRSSALRALLAAETERSQDFLRLANALSALYPKESEEKRLLDAMLLAAPR